MTKSAITRERLEKINSWRETYGAGSNVMLPAEEAEELARIALAAMDSEPVAEVLSNRPGNDTSTIDRALPVGTQLYRHAQQPVVPPEQHWEELCGQHPDMSIGDAVIRAAWWNHCRAAMLQASPVCTCPSGDGSLRWPCPVHPGNSPAQSDCCPVQNSVSPAQGGNSLVIPDEMTSEQAYEIGYYYGDPVDVFARGANWMRQHIIDSTLAAAPQLPDSDPATVPGKWIPVSERMPEDEQEVK